MQVTEITNSNKQKKGPFIKSVAKDNSLKKAQTWLFPQIQKTRQRFYLTH